MSLSIVSAPDYEPESKGKTYCYSCDQDKNKVYMPCGMPGRAGICSECSSATDKFHNSKSAYLYVVVGDCYFCMKDASVIPLLFSASDYHARKFYYGKTGICK